jgi:hypothetical protein
MTRSGALLAILLIGNFADESSAQSLGELARREEERRRQTTPGKQYTNADLPHTESESAPAVTQLDPASAAAAAPDPSPAKAPGADEDASPARGREKRDEQYWRGRARELRGHVQRTQTEIGSLEARLTELDTQAATSPDALRERDVTATHLRKLRQNLQSFGREVERFEQRARTDRVPADWIK